MSSSSESNSPDREFQGAVRSMLDAVAEDEFGQHGLIADANPDTDWPDGDEFALHRQSGAIAIDWDSTFAVDKRLFVRWMYNGHHAGAGASTKDFGFERTFNRVRVEVLSVASLKEDGDPSTCESVRSRFDSLALLGQMGVQAVGRPVVDVPRSVLRARG